MKKVYVRINDDGSVGSPHLREEITDWSKIAEINGEKVFKEYVNNAPVYNTITQERVSLGGSISGNYYVEQYQVNDITGAALQEKIQNKFDEARGVWSDYVSSNLYTKDERDHMIMVVNQQTFAKQQGALPTGVTTKAETAYKVINSGIAYIIDTGNPNSVYSQILSGSEPVYDFSPFTKPYSYEEIVTEYQL